MKHMPAEKCGEICKKPFDVQEMSKIRFTFTITLLVASEKSNAGSTRPTVETCVMTVTM